MQLTENPCQTKLQNQFPEHGVDANTLLRCADIAMYMAKSSGGGRYAVYAPERDTRTPDRTALRSELTIVSRSKSTTFLPPRSGLSSLATGAGSSLTPLIYWG